MFVFRFFSGAPGRNGYTNPLAAACTACALALGLTFAPLTSAQPTAETQATIAFDIPSQGLSAALSEYARQSGLEMLYSPEIVAGRTSTAVNGDMTRPDALDLLLQGTGLEFEQTPSGGMMVGDDAALEAYRAEQAAIAGQSRIGQRRPGIEEIIVTGQKKEERIQDVPIAITAFTQEDLTTQQIAGGPDLITQVPNFAFTKTNFSGYSIQIRGIGTQAISATTDPAVAVALNNTPFIRNRFFEQEFFDMERVEVLRGPQGTLFGRNATSGVVNLITAKPVFQEESMLSIDKGNYDSRRLEGMINVPLVDDKVALRLAGAWTKRDGYAINEITDSPIDGRDLWSTRATLRFTPNDRLDMNLIWEHFEEDDDRLRSGKQLCKTEEVTELAGVPTTHFQELFDSGQGGTLYNGVQGTFSQGCERNSLYASDSFQTPNGIMLPYYVPLGFLSLPIALNDPYVSRVQSRDLRVIESTVDPEYRAQSDIGELQISYQLTDTLTLESETGYLKDFIFSQQDFNRFNTASGAWLDADDGQAPDREGVLLDGPNGGVFCDPQVGCADRLVAVDLSTAQSQQFSQEFRLSSQFDGPLNFSLGANFLRYDTEDKYYVFVNSLTMVASVGGTIQGELDGLPPYIPGQTDNTACLRDGLAPGDPDNSPGIGGCIYIDPNPIGSLNDLGHNYFLSKNPFKLISYAVFGETYWNITDALKLTAGLRWSVDEKTAPLHPTWLFVPQTVGYPVKEVIEQTWREPTGRLVLDWKPQLDFTDETLLYGSYARGYKAGGANPPLYVGSQTSGSLTRPKTFDAEFVNAFEVGTKNTLLDGTVTMNMALFYYDYTDYQISEIVDRSAFNQNYDADVWGGELETDWWARENLRLSFKLGYTKTRIADGEEAIDLMDRAAGGKHFTITDARNPDFDPSQEIPRSEYVAGVSWDDIPDGQEFFAFDTWQVIRPFPIYPSSCIMPEFLYVDTNPNTERVLTNLGAGSGAAVTACDLAYVDVGPSNITGQKLDPVTWEPYRPNPGGCLSSSSCGTLGSYDPDLYPGFDPETAPNNGEGFAKDLGGNELPNAPNYTVTLSGDYIVPLSPLWAMTLHTDLHWQSKSWWRIFNDHEYNRLQDFFTMNMAAIFESETGWHIMAYVKNVTNETAMTGAFLLSDDTGLTTNVFLTEPRLFGLRVTRDWSDAKFLSRYVGANRTTDSPFSLEIGGQLLRYDAPNALLKPSFDAELTPALRIYDDPQERDLDWGDSRNIKLGYRPGDSPWTISAELRRGKANGETRHLFAGEQTEPVCPWAGPFIIFCDPEVAQENGVGGTAQVSRTNSLVVFIDDREEHEFINLAVSRDMALGGLSRSVFSVGLRRARFESKTSADFSGVPDWTILEGEIDTFEELVSATASKHTQYRELVEARREFEGWGPFASWEAAYALLDSENAGRIDLDWEITTGVLFGEQETSISGATTQKLYEDTVFGLGNVGSVPVETNESSFRIERNDSGVTVPTLGAELGVTYRVGGASIGAGYKWERYFDVIDSGFEERRTYDRTIDGPYLKVTFGGGE